MIYFFLWIQSPFTLSLNLYFELNQNCNCFFESGLPQSFISVICFPPKEEKLSASLAMSRKIILINKENKHEVYRHIARSFCFKEFEALPEHIKDDYLEWNWKEFEKEKRRINLERKFLATEKLYHLLKEKIDKFESINKAWFTKAKFLPFRRERHFNPTSQ